ncbi:MAG: PQQ-binding-like beta-propeller repeat protein [Phycisphaerae bacterium]|nr:PQQ-binding-like beta-propeller repeat protein [Phycisphaerae bacterium]
MISKKLLIIFVVILITTNTYGGYKDWPGYGNTATRHSITVDGPNVIDSNNLQWVADESPQGVSKFEFESSTGPVVYKNTVYAVAKYLEPNELSWNGYDQTASQLVAYDANSGQLLWTTVIDMAIYGSWSSPVVDAKNNNVLMPSGYKVYALNAENGTIVWTTQLDNFVVNASVCIAVDLPYARAFITDYAYYNGGKFYCINLDANEPNNPYESGEIVWSDVLGATCGNSPAYKDGIIYVSSNGGSVYAYDAKATIAVKIWQASDPNFEGFSSGVTVTKEGFLYASNYSYVWQEDNSALCKIDCNNGNIVWITNTEQTSSMPVVIGDKIYISGGINGYGSRPKVEAYQDMGTSVIKLWETPADMVVGGWSNQPVYANGKLYVGAIPIDGDYFGAYTELYVLDISTDVNDPNFVIAHYIDKECGNNPVVTYDSLYTIGYDGLLKFHQSALLADINKDSKVNYCDLAELAVVWLYDGPIGIKRADLNLDGKIDFKDYSLLAGSWYGELD